MTAITAIETRTVSKFFGQAQSRVIALDDVSLRLYRGELALLMGPSGSGKSSLIAALGGLQAPDTGSVMFEDKDLWDTGSIRLNTFRRKHCGFVFQSGGLFPALSALKQVAKPLQYLGFEKTEAYRKATGVLTEVGLGDRLQSLPSEMSGGQNQRVAIARMLAKDPGLIFCDEPTSALDGESGAVVAKLLQRAAHERNAMILCVTHDDRLRPFADRILEIRDGRITSDGRGET